MSLETIVCAYCQKTVTRPKGRAKRAKSYERAGQVRYCSRACVGLGIGHRDHRAVIGTHWKGGVSKAEKSRKYRAKYPQKAAAHEAVQAALLSGALIRQPCEVCHDHKVDAHHDDYTQPLAVRWLCRRHHVDAHAAGGRG